MMRAVPGVRRGATLFTPDDGYFYKVKKRGNVRVDYSCYKSNCNCCIYVLVSDGEVLQNKNFPGHSHEPEPLLDSVFATRQKIIERVERESLPPKVIFNDECNKVPIEVSKHLAFGLMESTLQKARRKCFPRQPNSATEFSDMLTSAEWEGRFGRTESGNTFYRRNIVVEGKNNLLFFPQNLELSLEHAEELHVDGTFKTVPTVPGLKQLFVVMAISYDHALPCCYVLMESRTYSSYKGIFSAIKEIVPGLKPKVCFSDFELGIMRAMKEEFPETQVTGCWWHYANRILKKARGLGIGVRHLTRNEDLRKVIHVCMALPLLPQDKIEEGLAAVRQIAAETALSRGLAAALDLLFDYIQSQWIRKVGADRLSVYGAPRRTNNDSESFNMTLLRGMGHAHPNAWAFLENLKHIENTYAINLERLRDGLPLGRNKRRKFLLKEKIIRAATQNFQADRVTSREFLSTVAGLIGRKVNFNLPEEDLEDDLNNFEEDEEVDRPPSPPQAHDTPPPEATALEQDEEDQTYRGPDLSNYRLQRVPLEIANKESCPPQQFVQQQVIELTEDLQTAEGTEVAQNPHQPLCPYCKTNKATRLSVPCGHWAGCVTCCELLVEVPIYFLALGLLEVEEIRLPVRCNECRGLIGKFVRVYS